METKKIPSAVPIYIMCAVWIVVILFYKIFPLYKLGNIIITAGVSLGAYFLGRKLFPGRVIEVETAAQTGDAQLDRQIEEGRQVLLQIEEAAKFVTEPQLSAYIQRTIKAGRQIFAAVIAKPKKYGQVRKFMNYYLPTSAKLLEQYKVFTQLESSGSHVQKSIQSIENSYEMIASAFEKQLGNLYRSEAMDIQSDIDVLETMLEGEGLLSDGIRSSVENKKDELSLNK